MNISKSLLALALSCILFISCKKTTAEPITETLDAPKEAVAVVKPETASFNIEGMTCAMGCAKTIEKELSELDGVQKATVDFDKKTAIVNFDATKQSTESLIKTVQATADGKTYTVSNLKSPADQAMVSE